MNQEALLVVDVQNIMFMDHQTPLYQGEKVLENIRRVVEHARKKKQPIVFIQHTTSDGEFKKGSFSWQIHPDIQPLSTEPVIEKSSWDAFYGTDLDKTLKQNGINRLVFVGMQTEFCLDTTCRCAYSRGYRSTLISDAHSTFDSDILTADLIIKHHHQTLGGRFVKLICTQDYL